MSPLHGSACRLPVEQLVPGCMRTPLIGVARRGKASGCECPNRGTLLVGKKRSQLLSHERPPGVWRFGRGIAGFWCSFHLDVEGIMRPIIVVGILFGALAIPFAAAGQCSFSCDETEIVPSCAYGASYDTCNTGCWNDPVLGPICLCSGTPCDPGFAQLLQTDRGLVSAVAVTDHRFLVAACDSHAVSVAFDPGSTSVVEASLTRIPIIRTNDRTSSTTTAAPGLSTSSLVNSPGPVKPAGTE